MKVKKIQEKPYQLRRTKLSNYQQQFSKIKKDFLHYKWVVDMNVEEEGSLGVRRRLEKVSKLLFEIEAEFKKNQ